MARRSSTKSTQGLKGRRGSPQPRSLALRLHPLPPMVSPKYVGYDAIVGKPRKPTKSTTMRAIQDRRTWFPSLFRPAASLLRRADTKLIIPKITRVTSVQRLPSKVAFAVPRRVLICVRRKVRKEIIHALGKGGSGNRKPRRNDFSDVSC